MVLNVTSTQLNRFVTGTASAVGRKISVDNYPENFQTFSNNIIVNNNNNNVS